MTVAEHIAREHQRFSAMHFKCPYIYQICHSWASVGIRRVKEYHAQLNNHQLNSMVGYICGDSDIEWVEETTVGHTILSRRGRCFIKPSHQKLFYPCSKISILGFCLWSPLGSHEQFTRPWSGVEIKGRSCGVTFQVVCSITKPLHGRVQLRNVI